MELTDGIRAPATAGLWIFPGTVGWKDISDPITITIDLGKPHIVNRVTFGTGWGISEVNFPKVIDIEASSDGIDFREVGCLSALNQTPLPPGDNCYLYCTFDAAFPSVNARYIRLRGLASGPYFFTDEIEVFAASGEFQSCGELPRAEENSEWLRHIDRRIVENGVKSGMNRLLNQICQKARTLPEKETKQIASVADLLRTRVARWKLNVDPNSFNAMYPIDSLHSDIFLLNTVICQAAGLKDFVVWSSAPDDPFDPLTVPAIRNKTLHQQMMNGEVRSAGLNFLNPSNKDIHFSAKLEGLPGEIYFVVLLDSNNQKTTTTILKPCPQTATAHSGMVGQLYINFTPTQLPAGVNRGKLILSGDGIDLTIPIELTISPVRFPKQTSLFTGLFDYLDFGDHEFRWSIPRKYQEQAVKLEREAHINVTFAESRMGVNVPIDVMRADKTGNLLNAPDFTEFDSWVAQYPDAARYVVYFTLHENSTFAGFAPGSAEFNRAVSQWAAQWDKHLEAKKLVDGKVIFLMIDEPYSEATYRASRQWIEAIKSGSDKIAILSNPTDYQPELLEELASADIICPLTNIIFDTDRLMDFQNLAGTEHELWIYRCHAGPFNVDPGYYRNQAWYAYRIGGRGSLFWSLGHTDTPNSLNQYLTRRVSYAPILITAEGLWPTKHLMAIRDGIQDYEYLVMLKRAIDDQRRQGNHQELTVAAERALANALMTVAQPENLWNIRPDGSSACSLAETERLKLLQWINQLTQP